MAGFMLRWFGLEGNPALDIRGGPIWAHRVVLQDEAGGVDTAAKPSTDAPKSHGEDPE